MLEILFRDQDLVAVNKPPGLLVHRSPLDPRETQFALQLLRDQLGSRVYPVHRLDRPTSGVLLFTLRQELVQPMAAAFARKEVHKIYLAVVRGFTDPEGCIDYALEDISDRLLSEETELPARKRNALTQYRRLNIVELPFPSGGFPTSRYSLLQVEPQTGRRHQIRRHLRHIFHPVIGDVKYGDGIHNRLFRHEYNVHRLLLHAGSLRFTHPQTGAAVSINAPLDDEFLRLLYAFGWQNSLPLEWSSHPPNQQHKAP